MLGVTLVDIIKRVLISIMAQTWITPEGGAVFKAIDYEGLRVSLNKAQTRQLRDEDLSCLGAIRLHGWWPVRPTHACAWVELVHVTVPVPQTPYAWFHDITHLTLSGTVPRSLVTPRQLEHLVIEHLYTRKEENGDHRVVSIDSTSSSLSILIQNSDLDGLDLHIGNDSHTEHLPKKIEMRNVCLPSEWLVCAHSVIIDTFAPAYKTLNLYDLWVTDLISLARLHSDHELSLHYDTPYGCVSVAPCKKLAVVESPAISLRYDLFEQFPVGTIMLNGVLAAPAPTEIDEDSEKNAED